MVKIIGKTLTPLGGLFGVVGQQVSTDELDLSSVQLVVDVADLAGYSTGPGIFNGRALFQVHQDFTVAVEQTDTIDAYTPALPLQGWAVPLTHDLWIERCFITVENTGMTVISWNQIMLDYPASYVGAEETAATAVAIEHVICGGNGVLVAAADIQPTNLIDLFPLNRPVWVPRGTSIVFNGKTSGAGNLNVTYNVQVLALPKGVYPLS